MLYSWLKSHIEWFADIKSQIKAAQYRALQKVNAEQVNLYWNIDKTILEDSNKLAGEKALLNC